jgi:hypothetical protein
MTKLTHNKMTTKITTQKHHGIGQTLIATQKQATNRETMASVEFAHRSIITYINVMSYLSTSQMHLAKYYSCHPIYASNAYDVTTKQTPPTATEVWVE